MTKLNTPSPSAAVVGLHFGKIEVIDSNGEFKPLLEALQVIINPRAASPRELIVKIVDHAPDLIGGAVAALTTLAASPRPDTGPQAPNLSDPASGDIGGRHGGLQSVEPEPAKPSREQGESHIRSAEELTSIFLQSYDPTRIADLRNDDQIDERTIGILKKDRSWKNTRLFLFSVKLANMFPDSAERRVLLKDLKARNIVMPNPGRGDTLTVSVQVDGTTRKAYRLSRSNLKTALQG